MMVAGMGAGAGAFDFGGRCLLGQLDPLAVDMVHRTDVDAVGADHFHVFPDLAAIGHRVFSCW